MTEAVVANQTAGAAEETFAQTGFGTVTNKRVIYFRNKGWLSGGSREDIPLKHVTSVRLDTKRQGIAGILFILVGLGLLPQGGGATAFGIALVALAILFLWGSPAVVVNTAGQDLSAAKGWPWQRGEAQAFVDALHKQLFK